MDLPDLSAVDFTVVRKRGYNPQEVDRFLEVLDAELRSAEREIRVMERRLAGLEEAAAGGETVQDATAASIAVAEAKDRLLARARSRAARILEQAYRHAGSVDPDTIPVDVDEQVRGEVAELLAEPIGSPAASEALEAGEPVESAHRQAKRFLRNAQLEAERIVAAARAEHQGLVARIARLQDLESQLESEGAAGFVPLRGRGVVVDLTGDEPVVTVSDSDRSSDEDEPRPAERDRSTRYARRSADLPSLGETEASFTDLAALRPDHD